MHAMQQLNPGISNAGPTRRSLPAASHVSSGSVRPLCRPQQRRSSCLLVLCKAKRGSGGSKGAQVAVSPKGFGEQAPVKQVVLQDGTSFVDNSLPVYRVYYRPNYLPPKYYGNVDAQRTADGSMGLVFAADIIMGDLLAVSTPLAYLEGSFGVPPELEDLQALMLEQPLTAEQRQILDLVRPAAAVKAATADNSASTSGSKQLGAGSIAMLDELYWQERQEQLLKVPKLGSKQLLEVLQTCAYSEEFHDPAAMQVRHQRPLGFTGLWPEFAAMAHSCVPNASVVVIKDRMLIHSNADGEGGQRVTFNKIGRFVAAPLAVRTAQLQEVLATTCGCARCSLEASLPAEVSSLISDAFAKVEGQWARAYQEGLMAGDGDALAALQEEMVDELEGVEEALADPELALTDQQQLWVRAGLYDAYDQVWQLEELLNEEPAHERLNTCLQLIKVFAKGSESHVALAMRLDERLEVASERLIRGARGKRRTAAAEKRLLRAVEAMTLEAEAAAMEYFEAVFARYGLVPEGLLPQLRQGQQLFYEGLQELSSMRAEGAPDASSTSTSDSSNSSSSSDGTTGRSDGSSSSSSSGASRSKELSINGVRVTVVDKVGVEDDDGSGADADAGTSGGGVGGGAAGQWSSSGAGPSSVVEVINAGGVRMQLVQDDVASGSSSGSSSRGMAAGDFSRDGALGAASSSGRAAGGSEGAEEVDFDAEEVDLEEFLGGVLGEELELEFGDEDEEGGEGDADDGDDVLGLLGDEGALEDGDEAEEEGALLDDAALEAAVRAFQQQQQQQQRQ